MQLTYNEHQIEQRDDNYVNLTQMAKANDVKLFKYFQSTETQKYLKAAQDSIYTESGVMTDLSLTAGFGKNKATWGHPLVALHFGQWISPEFYVWCNQNIHTLMTTGTTSINDNHNDQINQLQSQLSELTGLVTSLTLSVAGLVEPLTKTKQKTLKADLNHPNPEIKEIPTRTKVRKLITAYCYETNQNYRNVYQHLYERYNLTYSYNVYRHCEKTGEKCKLTQMEKDGEIDRFHQMVTGLVNQTQAA